MLICICNGISDTEIKQHLGDILNQYPHLDNETIIKLLQMEQYIWFQFNCGKCKPDLLKYIQAFKDSEK